MEFNLCGQKPAQVFLEPLDHEEKCFRNQKVASSESKIMDRVKGTDTAFNCQLTKNIKHIWAVFSF